MYIDDWGLASTSNFGRGLVVGVCRYQRLDARYRQVLHEQNPLESEFTKFKH